MICLTHLSGSNRGKHLGVAAYPAVLGRGKHAQVVLEEPGVWERHATLSLDAAGAFWIRAESQAMVVVNGVSMPEVELRSGDILDLGSASLRFGFGPTRQRSFRVREWSTWIAVALLCLGQIALVYLAMP